MRCIYCDTQYSAPTYGAFCTKQCQDIQFAELEPVDD